MRADPGSPQGRRKAGVASDPRGQKLEDTRGEGLLAASREIRGACPDRGLWAVIVDRHLRHWAARPV